DETDALRFLTADRLAEQQVVFGLGDAAEQGPDDRRMIAGCDTDPGVAVDQACRATGDRDIREQARADRNTVHGRVHRLAAVDDVVDEVARLAEHPGADREVRDHLLDEIEIAARREGAAGTTDDHRARLRVAVDGAPDLRQVAVHGGAGRVEASLRLHGDDQDPVLGSIEDEAGKGGREVRHLNAVYRPVKVGLRFSWKAAMPSW